MSYKRIHFSEPIVLIVTLILVLSSAIGAFADVKLPAIISDNMVLQQGMQVPIWGWAEPGEKVKVSGSWQIGSWNTTTGKDGKWMVKIKPPKAGGPYKMTISGENTIALNNILVGEVWICSGQSNMEMGIGLVTNAKQEIARADYPSIRLFHVPLRASGKPEPDVDAEWRVCSPKNISTDNIWEGWPRGFSAVAYFFGREIHNKLNVPVGLIATSWGGSPIEPWTPPIGFKSAPELKDILRQVEQANLAYNEAVGEAMAEFEGWWPTAKEAFDAGKSVPLPPAWPRHSLKSSKKPTGLYNGMIHPLIPFAIRGAIWYQGEANLSDGMLYYKKMEAMIGSWRKLWGQGDFPFYFVQIAPYRYRWGLPDPYRVPKLWEAQTAVLAIPNTGMAVTVDISDLDDIHPKNKQEVGRRLSLWALAKTYGCDDIVYSGPLYKSMSVEGKKIRISFEHTGSGLRTSDGRSPSWFEIAGADKNFVRAEAKIDGKMVVVWSEKVAEPVAVRFGWHEEAEPNLINKEGLPASPFRTDDWPGITANEK